MSETIRHQLEEGNDPMARKAKSKPRAKKTVAAKPSNPSGIDESALNKGQVRKLTVLRKSLGNKIADKAFADWLKSSAVRGGAQAGQVDKNAQLIAETLSPFAQAGKLRIPRGGYLVSRGRKRVIVERATQA